MIPLGPVGDRARLDESADVLGPPAGPLRSTLKSTLGLIVPGSARCRSPGPDTAGPRSPAGRGGRSDSSPPPDRPPPTTRDRGSPLPPRRRTRQPRPSRRPPSPPRPAEPIPGWAAVAVEAGPRQLRQLPRRVEDVQHLLGVAEMAAGQVPDPRRPAPQHREWAVVRPPKPPGLVAAAAAGVLGRLDRRDRRADPGPGRSRCR